MNKIVVNFRKMHTQCTALIIEGVAVERESDCPVVPPLHHQPKKSPTTAMLFPQTEEEQNPWPPSYTLPFPIMHHKEHSDKLHHHVVRLLHHVTSQCIMRATGGITGVSLTSLSGHLQHLPYLQNHQDWFLQPIPCATIIPCSLALPHLNSKMNAYYSF